MGRLLPSSTATTPDREPAVVGLDSEDADELVGALSSETARELLSELYDEPAAPSELADRVDTSLQNAQYHLGNLRDADLVEEVDTVYSEKGREMSVFAPASSPLVVVAGDQEDTSTLRTALGRLLGAVAVLGAASLAVQEFFGESVLPSLAGTGAEAGDGAGSGGATVTSAETAEATAEAAGAALPPGLLFFLGGVVALLLVAAWRYRRTL